MKLYDITKSFEENITFGPFADLTIPPLKKTNKTFSFLGKKVSSLFGVAACPLTHGLRAVSLMSKLGYDIITYRSVRSMEWHGQPFPNWAYVSVPHQLSQKHFEKKILASSKPFTNQEVSMVNSFGIQSLKPKYWQEDFELARKRLQSHQILILSLMFTPETGKNIVKDAEVVANYGNETSADIFEINLAHPNSGMKSLVYEDVNISIEICKKVKKILKKKKLLAKVSFYKNPNSLKEFMRKSMGIIDGITSSNTYPMNVVNKENKSYFPNRPKAALSGGAVRSLYMDQIRRIIEEKKDLQLKDFTVIGIGGVLKPLHIKQYLDLGVDAVQAAVGVFADPYLAQKYKNKYL